MAPVYVRRLPLLHHHMIPQHVDAEDVDTWITDRAYAGFMVVVGVFGAGDKAHLIVGNLLLALFVIFTCLSLRLVLREINGVGLQVWEIGLTLLKIVIGVAVVVFLVIWTFRTYRFMYPGYAAAVERQATERVMKEAAGEGVQTLASWWQIVWSKV